MFEVIRGSPYFCGKSLGARIPVVAVGGHCGPKSVYFLGWFTFRWALSCSGKARHGLAAFFSVTGNALISGFQVGARRGCRSHPVLVLRSGAHGFWWRAGQGSRAVYGGWIRFGLSGIGTLAVEALWRGRVKAMAISPSSSCPGRVNDPILFQLRVGRITLNR